MKKSVFVGALAALLASGTATVWSAGGPSHHQYNLYGEDVGLVGYDPVSYFPDGGGTPQKGNIKIAETVDGVTYRFASEEHHQLFKASPQKYLPAFGGWCAWAAGAIDKRVDVDPTSFDLRHGRLFVFYKDGELDARDLWLKDPEGLLVKADANWPTLSQ